MLPCVVWSLPSQINPIKVAIISHFIYIIPSIYCLDVSNFAEVFKSILDILDTWKELGTALGLTVKEIEVDNPNAKRRMKAVIIAWLQMKGSDPSWQSFCKVSRTLRDSLVGREDVQ